MGAIHGVRHTGFIGDVYKQFPFPRGRLTSSETGRFQNGPDVSDPGSTPGVRRSLSGQTSSTGQWRSGNTFLPKRSSASSSNTSGLGDIPGGARASGLTTSWR
jgi:hypothetical protein